MRVGLQLPILSALRCDAILEFARAAERLGFDSLWTNSHTAIPAEFAPRCPYSDDGRPPWSATTPWLDALTTLAFVAAATERGARRHRCASLPLARVEGRWLEASRELRDAGADLLVVLRRYDDGAIVDLERYAREVMPAL